MSSRLSLVPLAALALCLLTAGRADAQPSSALFATKTVSGQLFPGGTAGEGDLPSAGAQERRLGIAERRRGLRG